MSEFGKLLTAEEHTANRKSMANQLRTMADEIENEKAMSYSVSSIGHGEDNFGRYLGRTVVISTPPMPNGMSDQIRRIVGKLYE